MNEYEAANSVEVGLFGAPGVVEKLQPSRDLVEEFGRPKGVWRIHRKLLARWNDRG